MFFVIKPFMKEQRNCSTNNTDENDNLEVHLQEVEKNENSKDGKKRKLYNLFFWLKNKKNCA